MMKLRLTDLEYLIDINDLHDELGYVRMGPDEVRIGAMTRHRELLESPELGALFPIFADAERVIADPLARNRGTIGGSLCQADPSEHLSAVCTTLDASCVIRSADGERATGPWPPRVRRCGWTATSSPTPASGSPRSRARRRPTTAAPPSTSATSPAS